MQNSPSIYWFRSDLRTKDNPALMAAVEQQGPLVPVYIWDPEGAGDWSPGAASRWWLHYSLSSLQEELLQVGSQLIIRKGDSFEQLERLANETGAPNLYWNRCYEPWTVKRDQNIQAILRERGINVETFNASLLREPWEVETKQGKPYQVFTPFWKTCCSLDAPPEPLNSPEKLIAPECWPQSEPLDSLSLEPKNNWADGFHNEWQPGTTGAEQQLQKFLQESVGEYKENRDFPAVSGTCRLSPHLHFGEISPRQIWHAIQQNCHYNDCTTEADSINVFRNQIGWREFAHHVLHHFSETVHYPLRSNFEQFPWREESDVLEAWQQGQTGYPIVDAGMRELWKTGWMHNRVRMIVGSFLTKHLLISWQEGAEWFWETLVDADLANNTLGWQWISGCGADAAPYFRIFNPITQGEKFDPQGDYVRRWIPELCDLPDCWIHKPWNAPADTLSAARLELGRDYPLPIVDHQEARQSALAAFASIKNRK